MKAQQCLQILRDVKDAAFATVDEKGLPQIRIIDIMLVENEKLYFCTSRGKDFYKQLMHDDHVAITVVNKDYQMVRLQGTVEKLEDQKYWIDRIFEENPGMNNVYPNKSRYILKPFCIQSANLEFFDLGKEPIYREYFTIGKAKDEYKGYKITPSCIGCGKCQKICPQQCIQSGSQFQINQNHCLHCGLCYENCPVHAIELRGVSL